VVQDEPSKEVIGSQRRMPQALDVAGFRSISGFSAAATGTGASAVTRDARSSRWL
jgi:hypothetical protein